MKNIWDIVKNISAILGVLSVVLGFAWGAMVIYNRVFTSEEIRIESEKFHNKVSVEKVDRIRILDSIERINEEKWKLSQEKQLKQLDSLVRLGVYLSNKAAKSTDDLNKNVEHTLEHVDQ